MLAALNGGAGPNGGQFRAEWDDARAQARITIDLSDVRRIQWFAPFFEETICYAYFEAVTDVPGAERALTVEGAADGSGPEALTADGAVLPVLTADCTLRTR